LFELGDFLPLATGGRLPSLAEPRPFLTVVGGREATVYEEQAAGGKKKTLPCIHTFTIGSSMKSGKALASAFAKKIG
jgi:hypothetical protein